MKKRILIILLVFLVSFNVFAKDYNSDIDHLSYIRPMSGASGIPMNPRRETGNWRYSELKGPLDSNIFVGDSKNLWGDVSVGVPAEGQYSNNEIIAIGGITNMNSTVAKGSKYTITAQCENGFYFVSQSNPAYKRPFILYVIPKSLQETENFFGRSETQVFGKLGALSENSYKFSMSYPNVAMEAGVPFRKNLVADYFDSYTTWFDLVLCLPGKVTGSILEWNGISYPLTEADDYSAVVTITLEDSYTNSNQPGTMQSITIPFSGYFKETPGDRTGETISMYVHPYPSAGNINMRDYDPQAVANVSVQTGYENKNPSKSYGIFLSSDADPNKAGDAFILERDNLLFGDLRTPANSVPYTATLTRHSVGAGYTPVGPASVSYNGTTYLNAGGTIQNGQMMYPSYKNFTEGHRHEDIKIFDFTGDVSIQIEDNSGVLMEAGRYESEIYVHVVSL